MEWTKVDVGHYCSRDTMGPIGQVKDTMGPFDRLGHYGSIGIGVG